MDRLKKANRAFGIISLGMTIYHWKLVSLAFSYYKMGYHYQGSISSAYYFTGSMVFVTWLSVFAASIALVLIWRWAHYLLLISLFAVLLSGVYVPLIPLPASLLPGTASTHIFIQYAVNVAFVVGVFFLYWKKNKLFIDLSEGN